MLFFGGFRGSGDPVPSNAPVGSPDPRKHPNFTISGKLPNFEVFGVFRGSWGYPPGPPKNPKFRVSGPPVLGVPGGSNFEVLGGPGGTLQNLEN